MDETRYRLRDFVDSDFTALARMWSLNDPERPITEDEVRNLFRWSDQPRFVRYRRSIVETRSDNVVASGSLWQTGIFFDPEFAMAGISVDPAHQGQGLGRRLLEDLEAAARARGLKGLRAGVRADDARSVRFFERAGFREKRRAWTSRLDLGKLTSELQPRSPERWAAEGITFTTVAEEGSDRREVRERLYRLYLDTIKDAPRMGGNTDSTFEEFVLIAFEGPGYLPEAMFLARSGESYVSFSLLYRHASDPTVLHVSFTGTLPLYRGRGLAGELKRRTIAFARNHGYRYIETDNDSENERIWSINRQLGFQQFRIWIAGEKLL